MSVPSLPNVPDAMSARSRSENRSPYEEHGIDAAAVETLQYSDPEVSLAHPAYTEKDVKQCAWRLVGF